MLYYPFAKVNGDPVPWRVASAIAAFKSFTVQDGLIDTSHELSSTHNGYLPGRPSGLIKPKENSGDTTKAKAFKEIIKHMLLFSGSS